MIALVTLAAVAFGLADGGAGYAVLGPLGAVVLVASAALLSSRGPSRRALGSCGFVAGLVAVAVASVRGGSIVLPIATVATAAVGFALVPATCSRRPVRRVFLDSIVLWLVGGIALASLAVGFVVVRDAVRAISSEASVFGGLLSLQLLVLAAVATGAAASATLERMRDGEGSAPSAAFVLGKRLEAVPSGVYALLGAQVLAWLVFRPDAVVESALSSLGPVGFAVATVSTFGLLHGVVLTVCLGAGAVLAADRTWPFVAGWLEPIPLRTLAFASGGVLAAVALGGLIAATGTAGGESTMAAFALLVGVAVAVGVDVFPTVGDEPPLAGRWRSGWLATGVASLFVATLVAAGRDLPAVGVFAGVALVLFAWDVGSNVLSVRRQVGPSIDTRESELVRAAASVLVGAAGVAVAAAAMYVVGGASPPGQRWQAVTPIALALLAIVAGVAALERWPDALSLRDRVSVNPEAIVTWVRTHPVVALLIGVVAVALPFTSAGAVFALVVFVAPALLYWVIHRLSPSA